MHYKLRAYLPEDGSGFFQYGDDLFFVEYPYKNAQLRKATERQLENIGRQIELKSSDLDFEDFDSLRNFLSEQARSWKNPFGPTKISRKELISSYSQLPVESLRFLIEDLHDRFLNRGKVQSAMDSATIMLMVPAIQDDKELMGMTLDLLTDCRVRLSELEAIKSQPPVNTFVFVFQKHGAATATNRPLQFQAAGH